MKGIYLLSWLLIVTLALQAQTQPESATLELRNHQKVKGYIKNDDWIISPDKIKFKQEGENHFTTYGPEDVLYFRIGPEFYIGAEVDVDYAGLNAEDVTEDSAITLHREYHFLKRIGEGYVSLYALLLQNKRYNFYILKDSLSLLLCKRFIANRALIHDKYFLVNGENYYERSIFRSQLEEALPNHETIRKRIRTTEYSLYSLLALWKTYDRFNPTLGTSRRHSKRVTCGIVAGMGVGTTDYEFPEYNNLIYFGTKFKPFHYVQVGAEIKSQLGGRIGHISRHEIILHLDLRKMQLNGTDAVTNYNTFVNYPFQITCQTTALRGGFLYEYKWYQWKTGSFNFFLGGYASYHMINHNTATQVNGSFQYRDFRFTIGEGIMAGIGYRWKHVGGALTTDLYNAKNTIWRPLMNFRSLGIQFAYVF